MFSKSVRRVLWVVAAVLAAVLCIAVIVAGEYSFGALWLPVLGLVLFVTMTVRLWARGDFRRDIPAGTG